MPVHLVNSPGALYALRLVGTNTVGLLGLIQCRPTNDRENPPQPANGFNTAGTPFGNGHVLALNLGGTDDTRNLVPQWEQWQQTGVWRQVEVKCAEFNGGLLRCEVTYDGAALDQHAILLARMAANPLQAWADPRLPTTFRVRVYWRSTPALGAVLNDLAYTALASTLDSEHAVFDSGVLAHQNMPREDVMYWQNQVMAGQLKHLYTAFTAQEEARIAGQGQVLVKPIDFTQFVQHGDTRTELQAVLGGYAGFSPTDISGLQMERALRATHKLTQKSVARFRKLMHADFGADSKKKRHEASIARSRTEREKRIGAKRAAATNTTI